MRKGRLVFYMDCRAKAKREDSPRRKSYDGDFAVSGRTVKAVSA